MRRVTRCGAAAVLEVTGCGSTNGGSLTRFLLPCELLDVIPVSPVPRIVRPARWRHHARRVLATAGSSATTLQPAARASLDVLPFQLEPALALARGLGPRVLIADAVGLGKTIQAGLIVADTLHRRADARVLIVTPAGLREQWSHELRTRFALDAVVLDAAGVGRTQAGVPADVNPWSVHPLAITSIDFVKRPEVIRCHEPLLWDLLVFDEAHSLAGRSDRGVAADALARRARALVLLTATPHPGDEDAFNRLCAIGRLPGDGPLLMFRRRRADIGLSTSRRSVMLRVTPTATEADMHAALLAYARLVWAEAPAEAAGARLAMAVLTRRAASSAGSLVRSLQRRMALLDDSRPFPLQGSLPFGNADEDSEPDQVLGARGLADAVTESARLEHLLALAQTAARCESKLRALRRLLARARQPAIVFTEYRDTLDRIAAAVDSFDAVQLHGGLSPRERRDALRRFTSGSASLLLATDAGSEGLNLHQGCRLVVSLELPWTPLRLEQRVGRVDRIGQTRRVHAVNLVAATTCEEQVLARLTDRMARIDVAECVLGGRHSEHASSVADSLLGDVRVVSLAAEARNEAERIRAARLLAVPGAPDSRPCVTRIRRRWRRRESFWLFRVVLMGADEQLVATFDFGLRAPWITCMPDIERAAAEVVDGLLPSVTDIERARLRVQVGRERALREELRAHQARLAGGLLQRGLFDHRHERAAASQASLLASALASSADRLGSLVAAAAPGAHRCELLFAVAFD